jgi:pyruvate dehydrogenase E2 component (dihydrolipoamide acetyltransferase)
VAEAYTIAQLSPMRKIIAARMTEAKRAIPHFRIVANVEVDAMLGVYRELRERNSEEKLSLNALMIKACATALMDFPAINIQLVDNEVRHYKAADISVVTALKGGLFTPIVRGAESKSIRAISREIRGRVSRAADNSLRMDEILGGSFSVSNLGMYDVDQFDAIINPPQCAILAVGAAKPRVALTKEGELKSATLMAGTLSVDHRAIDGITAARFMSALRHRLEQPEHLESENDS